MMSQDKKEAITAEVIRFMGRLEEYKEQLITEPIFWPPPGGRAGYRRMAARLRSGKLPSPNPEFISAEDFADYLDLCVEQAELRVALAKEARAFGEWLQTALDDLVGEIWEQCQELYKEAKKMAEVQGPDSGAAKYCHAVQTVWRQTQGRHHRGSGRTRSERHGHAPEARQRLAGGKREARGHRIERRD